MLILLCWFFASTNFRMHEHIVNGERIAHSHPGAADGHSHSDAQLATIDLLAHFLTERPDTPACVGTPLTFVAITNTEHSDCAIYSCILDKHKLRGPPQTL